MRFAAPLLATLAVIAGPTAAMAQQSPFAPLPQAAQPTTPTVVAPGGGNDPGGLATWQEFLIFGAGLILLFGIGWAIVSDARAKAPVKESELAHPGAGGVRQNRSRKQKERARAKAKVARTQRKRNRSRR